MKLELEFWTELQAIADRIGVSLETLVASIEAKREGGTLASALRLAVLNDLQERLLLSELSRPPAAQESQSAEKVALL